MFRVVWCLPSAHATGPVRLRRSPPHYFSAVIPSLSVARVVISVSTVPTLELLEYNTWTPALHLGDPLILVALQVRCHGDLGDRTLIAPAN